MSKKIALLGATGYIGTSLLAEFVADKSSENIIDAFSRDVEKLKSMVQRVCLHDASIVACKQITELNQGQYDVIINATGAGDTRVLRAEPANIFSLTEAIDSLVVSYLEQHPETIYINLSSGAVYGDNFQAPLTAETKATFAVNQFKLSEYYSIAKLHAEAKHRALSEFKIIDLRVFAFFSHFVDPKAEFLMSEIVDCLQTQTVFKTNSNDIVRDYITPVDLYQLILGVILAPSNVAYDVYSKAPVKKFDLLESLKENFGLQFEVSAAAIRGGDKFSKSIYYSENHRASEVGYRPAYTALQGIEIELSRLRLA